MAQIRRVRGVLLLTLVSIVVYALEVSLATLTGFPDSRGMLSALTYNEKRLVAFVIGPLLHQGGTHLAENLVFLLVFGSYVEWQIGLRRFLTFSAIVGYFATWILLLTGSVGAVGASSITNGLEPIAGFIGLTRLAEGITANRDTKDLLSTTLHSVPLVIGLGFAWNSIEVGMGPSIDATIAIHALGTLVGILIGFWYFSQLLTQVDGLRSFTPK